MDLAELKAENLAKEKELEASPQDVDDKLEVDEDEDDTEELDEAAELDQEDASKDEDPGDAEKSELEDWQKADDEDAGQKFDNSDMASVRRKYKGKLEKANEDHVDEVQQLNARIEQLEKGKPTPVKSAPNRDDYDDDLTYLEARQDWKNDQSHAERSATQASEAIQSKQLEAKHETDGLVAEHYTRVDKLVGDSKNDITADLYYNSDLTVRQAVEAIIPKGGDAIIDHLIASIGTDSEKVMYSLGVNKNRLGKFINLLKSDPLGIKASMYLGELKSSVSAPSKRKTKAPDPAKIAAGDKQLTGSVKSAKKAYDNAKDPQGRFDAKKKAKSAGHDTRDW